MATVRQKLGKQITKIRKERGLTQEKLAELASIDYSYLNLIENGKRNPSINVITKIARALKTPLNELVP